MDDGKRRERKSNKRQTKKLGRVAQAAIAHNEELVERFIAAISEGKPTPYVLGVAEGNPEDPRHPGTVSFGGGVFSVRIVESGEYVRAALRGLMHGRGGFFHNPEVSTAVRAGSYVVVEDLGLGHMAGGTSHQIMGVMTSGQASRARRAHGLRGDSSSNSLFERSSEERRDADIRAGQMARLNRARRTAKRSSNAPAAAGGKKSSSSSSSSKKSSNSYRGEGW
jgi:hypothetical protein